MAMPALQIGRWEDAAALTILGAAPGAHLIVPALAFAYEDALEEDALANGEDRA
jgi:hypothetical protein